MEGVTNGFRLSFDSPTPVKKVLVKNYFSCFKYRNAVESQILEELENGRYLFTETQPSIVSALGALPKKNGKIRLIHDCSRPSGAAANDFAIRDKFKYTTLQDAIKMINPGDFLAKVDLQSAYRSVKVSRADRDRLGISWCFEAAIHPCYLIDLCLPFGHARSCFVFNELSQAVCRIMSAYGYDNIIAYLDNFLIAAKSYSECKEALNFLLFMLRRLGFAISYPKVEGPVQQLIFLGFLLDTLEMTVALTRCRVEDLNTLLKDILCRAKISKRALQSVIGKLNYCTQVVYGGRFFLRRLINIMTTLSQPWHRCRVNKEMRADIQWWLSIGLVYCSKPLPMVKDSSRSGRAALCVDACQRAAGGFYMGDFVYQEFVNMEKGAEDLCINHKEVLALLPAIRKWAPYFKDKHLHIYSDNTCAVSILTKGTSKHPLVMSVLREIYYYSVMFNFRFSMHHYCGIRNKIADAISRMHELYGVLRFNDLLLKWYQTNAYNSYLCQDNSCLCCI